MLLCAWPGAHFQLHVVMSCNGLVRSVQLQRQAVVGKKAGRPCVVDTDVLSRHGVGYDLGVRVSPMQRMRAMQYSSCRQ